MHSRRIIQICRGIHDDVGKVFSQNLRTAHHNFDKPIAPLVCRRRSHGSTKFLSFELPDRSLYAE